MTRFHRKVIRIRAEDSPNVRAALARQAAGRDPAGAGEVLPGVVGWAEYQRRRLLWDPQRQCEGLDAEWYMGPQLLLFPPERLRRAEELARGRKPAGGRCWMGMDSAEGGDNTCWAVIDGEGLLYMLSLKTPDTAVIPGKTVALCREWGVKPEDVAVDRGGGGTQHAHRLREMGWPVRTVAFGNPVDADPRRATVTSFSQKVDKGEERYAYVNLRARMYHRLSQAVASEAGFALPAEILDRPRGDGGATLRRQLLAVPKLEDAHGRYYLPPKNPRPVLLGQQRSAVQSLTQLIGCSPDEADALVLAVEARDGRPARAKLGAMAF